MKFIKEWKEKREISSKQELKNRVLKNRECVLDAFAENIKGARACPFLMGQKCIGSLCEFFAEYTNLSKDGKKTTYYKCNVNQIPILLIELNNNIRELKESLKGF